MASVNKVILIGNLGRDPEVRNTSSGIAVATLALATSEQWKDKSSGEKKEQTEWHRLVLWDRLAEIVGEYLHKGDSIYVEGKLQTRKWEDKDGVERYTTEINVTEMKMLKTRRDDDDDDDRGRSRGRDDDRGRGREERSTRGDDRPARSRTTNDKKPESRSRMTDDEDDIPFR